MPCGDAALDDALRRRAREDHVAVGAAARHARRGSPRRTSRSSRRRTPCARPPCWPGANAGNGQHRHDGNGGARGGRRRRPPRGASRRAGFGSRRGTIADARACPKRRARTARTARRARRGRLAAPRAPRRLRRPWPPPRSSTRLAQGPLLADGAMGTLLFERGIAYERCFDELNLSSPGARRGDPPRVPRRGRRADRDEHVRRERRPARRPRR